MNINHPCCKLKIWNFLGITFEKLVFDKIFHIMCILVSQNDWHRENVIISNSLQENDKKVTLLIFYHYKKLKIWKDFILWKRI